MFSFDLTSNRIYFTGQQNICLSPECIQTGTMLITSIRYITKMAKKIS